MDGAGALKDRGKHNPVRTCIGCAVKSPKGKLFRIVVDEDGLAVWDVKQNMPGRGAYIHPSESCCREALKKGRFNRAFRKVVKTEKIENQEFPWER